MMNSKTTSLTVLMIAAALFVSACSSSAEASQEPTATVPSVIDSSQVIAEGRVEPIHYAEIAFTASGVVSEVLVKEGRTGEKGRAPDPPGR